MTLYEALATVNRAKAEYAGEEHRQEATGKDDPDRLWGLHAAVLDAERDVEDAVLDIVRRRLTP